MTECCTPSTEPVSDRILFGPNKRQKEVQQWLNDLSLQEMSIETLLSQCGRPEKVGRFNDQWVVWNTSRMVTASEIISSRLEIGAPSLSNGDFFFDFKDEETKTPLLVQFEESSLGEDDVKTTKESLLFSRQVLTLNLNRSKYHLQLFYVDGTPLPKDKVFSYEALLFPREIRQILCEKLDQGKLSLCDTLWSPAESLTSMPVWMCRESESKQILYTGDEFLVIPRDQ